jgi:hypothetical protein
MIVKTGKLEIGKTPSIKSGKTATKIVKGEPLHKSEAPIKNSVADLSKSLNNSR